MVPLTASLAHVSFLLLQSIGSFEINYVSDISGGNGTMDFGGGNQTTGRAKFCVHIFTFFGIWTTIFGF